MKSPLENEKAALRRNTGFFFPFMIIKIILKNSSRHHHLQSTKGEKIDQRAHALIWAGNMLNETCASYDLNRGE